MAKRKQIRTLSPLKRNSGCAESSEQDPSYFKETGKSWLNYDPESPNENLEAIKSILGSVDKIKTQALRFFNAYKKKSQAPSILELISSTIWSENKEEKQKERASSYQWVLKKLEAFKGKNALQGTELGDFAKKSRLLPIILKIVLPFVSFNLITSNKIVHLNKQKKHKTSIREKLESLIPTVSQWGRSPQCTLAPWQSKGNQGCNRQSKVLEGTNISLNMNHFPPIDHLSCSKAKNDTQMKFSIKNGVLTIKKQSSSQRSLSKSYHQIPLHSTRFVQNPTRSHPENKPTENWWRSNPLSSSESIESQEETKEKRDFIYVSTSITKESYLDESPNACCDEVMDFETCDCQKQPDARGLKTRNQLFANA